MNWFAEGGFIMWPILISGLLMIGYAGAAYRARRGRTNHERARSRTDAVLFWGVFAAALGVLGTLVGFAQMAQALEAAGTAPPTLIWGGLRVALVTTVFGLLILLSGFLLWFALRLAPRISAHSSSDRATAT